jgi:hypothetical protein
MRNIEPVAFTVVAGLSAALLVAVVVLAISPDSFDGFGDWLLWAVFG